MTRLLVLAEGASEELFVNTVLSPHLQRFGVFPRATGVITRRLASGKKTTGGNLWSNVRLSLRPLLADSDAWVTTLLDYYGLPEDFPGVTEAARLTAPPLEVAVHRLIRAGNLVNVTSLFYLRVRSTVTARRPR